MTGNGAQTQSTGTPPVTDAQSRLLADVARGAVTHQGGHAYRAGCRVDTQVSRLVDAGLIRRVRVHDFLSRYELTAAGQAAAGCEQRPARESVTSSVDPFALVGAEPYREVFPL